MQNTIPKLFVALFAFGITAANAGNVNVAVSVSGQVQPGVYGRIDIGNAPPPVVYEQPVLIMPPARPVRMEPLYLHVPPGHAKKWSKFCYKYDACGRPVYFVRSDEYVHDSYYARRGYEHDYARYRYVDHDDHHGHGHDHDHDNDHHDHGKHKGDKHHKHDD
jgi:hypothetical protein